MQSFLIAKTACVLSWVLKVYNIFKSQDNSTLKIVQDCIKNAITDELI